MAKMFGIFFAGGGDNKSYQIKNSPLVANSNPTSGGSGSNANEVNMNQSSNGISSTNNESNSSSLASIPRLDSSNSSPLRSQGSASKLLDKR